ncbi:hypothetical protein [Endozoicomonas euniceicola]|uniref:Uncharacterized protein n=1 Tax=Endozoicomonas euniceicola TaxID=1234143 RepID=A0ABY6GWR6_9GAMM|nr:hypothetical protein [Endozoicomonas euniceicola]UYM17227.1 hypothetical protein NX720_04700 [Endozoicomonas euniceicola]
MTYLTKKSKAILTVLIISLSPCFILYAASEDIPKLKKTELSDFILYVASQGIPKLKKTELWDEYGQIGFVSYSKGCEKATDNWKAKAFLSGCTIELEGIPKETQNENEHASWGSRYYLNTLRPSHSNPIRITFEDISSERLDGTNTKYSIKIGDLSKTNEYTTYLQLDKDYELFEQQPELLALSLALQPQFLLNFTNLTSSRKFVSDFAWPSSSYTTLKIPYLPDASPLEIVLEQDYFSHGFRLASSLDKLEKVVIYNVRSKWKIDNLLAYLTDLRMLLAFNIVSGLVSISIALGSERPDTKFYYNGLAACHGLMSFVLFFLPSKQSDILKTLREAPNYSMHYGTVTLPMRSEEL